MVKGTGSGSPGEPAAMPGALFHASGPYPGRGLWKTKGLGGYRIASFADSGPNGPARVGQRLYFSADDGVSGTDEASSGGSRARIDRPVALARSAASGGAEAEQA